MEKGFKINFVYKDNVRFNNYVLQKADEIAKKSLEEDTIADLRELVEEFHAVASKMLNEMDEKRKNSYIGKDSKDYCDMESLNAADSDYKKRAYK